MGPSVDEIEHRLRALKLPEIVVQKHVRQLRRLRSLPRRRLVRVHKPGRYKRYVWELVEET